MKQFLQIQIITVCIALSLATAAQTPAITTRVDKKDILIGQQIELQLKVSMPDNAYRLTWFAQPEDFGTFVVAGKEKIDSAYGNGLLSFSQKLLITSFDSGRQTIPSLAFHFDLLQNDSSFVMYSDSIPVNVSYSPADSVLPFHDIKPIIPVKIQSEWWFWPAIIVAALLLIVILLIYLRRRRKKTPESIFDTTLSPYEEAQKNFDALQSQNLPSKGRYSIFFASLSDIVKKYLSRVQNRNLMALTGAELIEVLKDMITQDKLSSIAACVRMGEAAKFAKFNPSEKDCANALEEMQKLVEIIHASIKPPADDV